MRFFNHKTSGDRPRLSYEGISDYPINLTSIEEQHFIVQELESKLTVCDKIEETITSRNTTAKCFKESVWGKVGTGCIAAQCV